MISRLPGLLFWTSSPTLAADLQTALFAAFVVAAVLFAIAFLAYCAFKALYKRTGANLAFVRTGQGKARVVVDGGAFVVGFLHQIKWINLETLRIQVHREGKDALITKDKFRVDISVEFYIRVDPVDEQILRAARTLGDKSLTPETVKQLIEAKLVGALRSVAATKNMIELHQDRQTFEDEVQEALKRDLEKNGLTLESVAIVHLDQTDKNALDPNNVFDAEGLKLITDATEKARKEKNEIQRNAELAIKEKDVTTDIAIKGRVAENQRKASEIQQETDVQVKRQVVEAEKKKITMQQDLEQAAALQMKSVEVFKTEQLAETERYKYEQDQSVRTREIEKERGVEQARIEKERAVRQAEVEKDLRVKEAEISRETLLVTKRREMQEAQIGAELAIERARRDKEIAIIEKVRQQEAAEAEKLATVAERERAEQAVLTVQATQEADRERQVAILKQKAVSEQGQLEKQLAADALAYEVRKKAEADALAAEQQAAAIERIALARLKEAEARAEGERRMVEARNLIAPHILVSDAAAKLIEHTPSIVRELMKPAEKISDIKILNVTGPGIGSGVSGTNGTSGGGGDGSIVGKVVSSLLEAGAAYPMFKELLKFANVDLEKTSAAGLAQRAVEAVKGFAPPATTDGGRAAAAEPATPMADVSGTAEGPAAGPRAGLGKPKRG